jgi:hypothetical protein
MPPLTAEQLTAVQSLKDRMMARVEADPQILQQLSWLGQYLVDSENQLIALMNTTPPPASGGIEFGSMLYWIHNDLPKDEFFTWLASKFPPTQIKASTYADWQHVLATTGKVAPDGTLYGDGTFSQLDKGWTYAFVLYLLGIFKEIPKAPLFPSPAPTIVPITLPNNPTLNVALIGDWGTGSWNDCGTKGPAVAIMEQLQQSKAVPDVIIHVGDVYYAGTGHLPLTVNLFMMWLAGEMQRVTGVFVPYIPTEETFRLVDSWWQSGPVPLSFTLNSNHEMYSGANGYYYEALAAPLYVAQNKASYFAIYYQDWAILGLDSAFYSESFFCMEGALQDAQHAEQVAWVQKLDLTGKKVIALTHHTALSVDGLPIRGNQLCNDMYAALNKRDPDYWYWGHIHNGVVYNSDVTMSSSRQTTTLCRCVGHSAVPFGDAYYWKDGETHEPLGQNPNVEYYAGTPLPNPNDYPQWKKRVKNGFAVLTLSQGAIQEAFYEQGSSSPVWPAKVVKLASKARRHGGQV